MTEIQRESFPFRLHWQESSELLVLVYKALCGKVIESTGGSERGVITNESPEEATFATHSEILAVFWHGVRYTPAFAFPRRLYLGAQSAPP
jgi:hypothetical protein